MKPLIIVCGLGRTGYKIYNLLQQQGAEVVGISDRPMTLQDREKLIIGDARSPAILVKAGIR
nr:NAD-binding protein [Xenococcaceae cyanobacterium MO_234.B1]